MKYALVVVACERASKFAERRARYVKPVTDDSPLIGRDGSYSKGIARRQEILDRAVSVFAERGVNRTSLRRIADAIGVSHGALSHYFDSREQLLVAVYEHAERKRTESGAVTDDFGAVETIVTAAGGNARVAGVVQLYASLVATALEDENDVSKSFFTDRFHSVRNDLATRIRRDQVAGVVRRDVDADAIAALLVAASDGMQVQWLLEPSVELDATLAVFATLLQP
jgi:AcrR family transcriptional regulator